MSCDENGHCQQNTDTEIHHDIVPLELNLEEQKLFVHDQLFIVSIVLIEKFCRPAYKRNRHSNDCQRKYE